jgi:hypothetical protein
MEELATTPLGLGMQLFQNTEVSHDSHLLVLVCYMHENATGVLRILISQELEGFLENGYISTIN